MAYVGCGRSKASEIRRKAIVRYNGSVPLFPKKVYRDAVLKVLGIVHSKEVKKIKYLQEETL